MARPRFFRRAVGKTQAACAQSSSPRASRAARRRRPNLPGRRVSALMNQLKAEGLRKKYKTRTVVHDVSLEVSSGEVVGLLGPNGAGKTTCFYMIVGLVPM